MDVASIAERAVSLSEKHGASQADAYAITVRTRGVYIDDDMPKIGASITETGVGLRFVLGKKIGFTSSTLTTETLEDLVERAKTMARVSSEDPKFESLPEPKKISGSSDRFFSRETASVDADAVTEMAMMVVNSAASDKVTVSNGTLRVSDLEFRVVNSLGVDAGSRSTTVFGFFAAKSSDSGEVGEGIQ
ncbi:MAG: hypothetical protein DRO87_11890, partial [Candidatus Thorarchaeota archaeon]